MRRKEMDAEAKSIIDAIHEAFRGVARGRISLHEAEAIDAYASDEECAAVRSLDTETRWEDVPDQHIAQCTAALSHVDPESWRYYIPRYMEWSLCNFRSSDSVASDFTIYTFAPARKKEPQLREYSLQRYRLLTAQQSRVVYRFLRYMAGQGEHADSRVANEAIRDYWEALAGPLNGRGHS
jgi:hypothetical protein